MSKRHNMPSSLLLVIEETGATIEEGKRHLKIRVHGRLAAVWPLGKANDRSASGTHNVIACVRRAARGVTSR